MPRQATSRPFTRLIAVAAVPDWAGVSPGLRIRDCEARDRHGFVWPLIAAVAVHAGLVLLFALGESEAPPLASEQGVVVTMEFVRDSMAATDGGLSSPAVAPDIAEPVPDSATPDTLGAAAAGDPVEQQTVPAAAAPESVAATAAPEVPAPKPVAMVPPAASRPAAHAIVPARPKMVRQGRLAGPVAEGSSSPGAQVATTSGPAAVSPAPTSSASSGQPDGAWEHGVILWLQAHRTYPPMARQRGEQGAALVRLTVDRDGRVRTFTLMQSTGSPRLDAAVEGLLGHAELPPFPPSMPQATAVIDVPIRYRLES